MSNLAITTTEPDAWTEQLTIFASEMKMDVDLPIEALIENSRAAITTARKLEVGAGISLLAAKSKCTHGEFIPMLKNSGIHESRATELMAVARLLSNTPAAQRAEMLQQPKTVLIGMARMDDEVLAAALEDGVFKERLTIQEFEAELKKQQALNTTLSQQLDVLRDYKKQADDSRIVSSKVPHDVSDIRRELCALHLKAELAITDMGDLAQTVCELGERADTKDWMDGAAQMAYSQLRSLAGTLSLKLQGYKELFGVLDELPTEEHRAYLRPEEAAVVAQHGAKLKQAHYVEVNDRDKVRKNERADATGAKGRRFDTLADQGKAKK